MTSEEQAQPQPTELWDAPNQQVVRADESPPWEEGTGGSGEQAESAGQESGGTSDLDSMTKAELLDYAKSLEVSPANNDMTKEELRAGIDSKLAEEGGT